MTGIWLVSYIALWVLLLAVAVVLVSVLRNLGVLAEQLARFQAPPEPALTLTPDQLVPALALQTLAGEATSTTALHGQASALTFISPGCGPCTTLLHHLASAGVDLASITPARRQVIISLGDSTATSALLAEQRLPPEIPVLLAAAPAVGTAWGIHSTPTTVILDAQGHYLRHTLGFTPPPTVAAPTRAIAVGDGAEAAS